MELRRKKTQEANEKRKKKNEERRAEIGGSPRAYHKNKKKDDKVVSKTTTKQGKPKTKAQLLATKNIKKYGGTAKAAAANKEANRLRIKKAYLAKKKKK